MNRYKRTVARIAAIYWILSAMAFLSTLHAQEDMLIGLTVADVMTTSYIVNTGGVEFNPLLPAENLAVMILIKGILVTLYLRTEPPKKHVWVMNFILSTAVINNIYQINHRRGVR